MAKLFWAILAAGQAGYRYLRAVMRLVPGLACRMNRAPGADGRGLLRANTGTWAEPVARSAADGQFAGRESGKLLSRMVAWLVSASRFTGKPEAKLTTAIKTLPAKNMQGSWTRTHRVDGNIQACPGVPMVHRKTRETVLAADAGMAPPRPVEVRLENAVPDLKAGAMAGGPIPVTASVFPPFRADAGIRNGTPAAFSAKGKPGTAMTARMMAWAMPYLVDGSILYIRQVYETRQDGDVLVLH